MAILCATLWLGLLILALWMSQRPADIPDFVLPASLVPCIAATYFGIRQLYRHIGGNAVVTFPMLVFLCSIPIYLLMEVTIM